ncbi:MAG: DUF6714 family protein [Planctomycetaceae bacterium]
MNDASMKDEAAALIGQLEQAFRGVKLGHGVGLYEALEIDSYSRDEVREKARERDEKDDWTRLGPDELRGSLTAMGYFDPEGMRFHLPAYLRAEIISPFIDDLLVALLMVRLGGEECRLSLLSHRQRKVVRECLVYIMHQYTDSPEDCPMCQAIQERWVQYLDQQLGE